MSKTKNELKREIKNTKAIYGWAIKMKCFDCMGQLADGYYDCKITKCSLYPFKLKRGNTQTKIFKRLSRVLEKIMKSEQYPTSSFWLEVLQKEILGLENGVRKN